jgi:hypothetical protein
MLSTKFQNKIVLEYYYLSYFPFKNKYKNLKQISKMSLKKEFGFTF